MELVIRYYKDGERTEEVWNDRTLEEARNITKGWVSDGSADLVEIYDDAEQLLFHWPRGLPDDQESARQ